MHRLVSLSVVTRPCIILYPQLWVVYCFVSDFSVSLYIFIHLDFCVISLFEMFASGRLIVGDSVMVVPEFTPLFHILFLMYCL